MKHNEVTTVLEVCITRHECMKSCQGCRYNGDQCINAHVQLSKEHKEFKKLGKGEHGTL